MKAKLMIGLVMGLMTMIGIIACVNTISMEDETEINVEGNDGKNITFQITALEQISVDAATRAEVPISELCTNINLALYQGNSRVQKIDQDADDNHFGTISARLPYGNYTLVCLAHSSEGNATTTNLEKITFPSSYITDTFLYCADIEVSEDSETIQHISLRRVVAKFELDINDNIPEEVTQLQIKYYGGSSSLNARTGAGMTHSNQHEEFENLSHNGESIFGVYSFLFEEEGNFKFTIVAYDEEGEEVFSRVFENVPMKRNNITRYRGKLFGKGVNGTITADSTWTHTNHNF